MKIKFEWEQIGAYSWRAKVIGGWAFTTNYINGTGSTIFIPDQDHSWEIEE